MRWGPAAIGDAGIGKVVAVAEWMPNVPGAQSEAFYQSFRVRFPKPQDDYVHLRMQLMVEALAQSIEAAGSVDTTAIAPDGKGPCSNWPGAVAACALQTTSSSSRWWWA